MAPFVFFCQHISWLNFSTYLPPYTLAHLTVSALDFRDIWWWLFPGLFFGSVPRRVFPRNFPILFSGILPFSVWNILREEPARSGLVCGLFLSYFHGPFLDSLLRYTFGPSLFGALFGSFVGHFFYSPLLLLAESCAVARLSLCGESPDNYELQISRAAALILVPNTQSSSA